MKSRTLVADRRYYGLDPVTLRTEVRRIVPGSDFHRLAHQLETVVPWRTEQGF